MSESLRKFWLHEVSWNSVASVHHTFTPPTIYNNLKALVSKELLSCEHLSTVFVLPSLPCSPRTKGPRCLGGWEEDKLPSRAPNSQELREERIATGSFQEVFRCAALLGNMQLLIMEKHQQRKSSPGVFFAGRSLRVWGVRKLLSNHYDRWEQPWATAASKVYFFFLHIHTVCLQYYTLTYIKYRMFLKLLQRGANVWQFISEILFFFPQQAAQSHFKPAAVKVMWEICCHLWIISYM